MSPKVLIVGDLMLPCETIRREFKPLEDRGFKLTGFDWPLKNHEELTANNLAVEKGGPEAVDVPPGLMEEIETANILAVQFCPVSRAVLQSGRNLKLVGIMRAGVENIDLEAAQKFGIGVLNVRGRNAQAVAEFTLGLLLGEARNIARSHHALVGKTWRKNFQNSDYIPELHGRILGIIGMGEIGRRLVKLLSGFEMARILVYDPYVSDEEMAAWGIEKVDLEELLRESDFISLNARLTEETRHLISKSELALMKPHAYIVNTARAGLIDEESLEQALRQRKIGGAALDVFAHEPLPPESALLKLDNITMTSHLAGTTVDAWPRSARILVEDILRLLDGKRARYAPVRDLVDPIDWRHEFGLSP
jgi:D-3-phosphoglycerate dehydrogenase